MEGKENITVKIPKKVVLVVGNGFDLDLGFHTSYAEFVDSEIFRIMVNESKPRGMQIFNGADYEKLQVYPNGLAAYVKAQNEHNNWVDLEECIREYYEMPDKDAKNMALYRKEVYTMRYYLFQYLYQAVTYDFEMHNSLYKNFIAFRLLNAMVTMKVDFQIWDFNYTFTCENLLERIGLRPDAAEKRVHYIHGRLYEEENNERWPIVLGSNYTPKLMKICPSAIKSQVKGYSERCKAIKQDLSEADVIIFMGHSVGSTDRQYFDEMLDSSKRKDVVIITKSDDSLDVVRGNLEDATREQYGRKIEEMKVRELTYTTETYYDETRRHFNAAKWKEFDNLMQQILQ